MILSDVGTFLGLLGGLPGGVAALLLLCGMQPNWDSA